MGKVISSLAVSVILILLGSSSAYAQSVNLRVNPDRGQISVGDIFYITITAENVNGEPSKPSSVSGANVLYFTHSAQSTSISTINGKTTQRISNTWTVTLRAKEEGKFSFGPITIGSVKSNEVHYNIGAPMPQQNSSQNMPGQGGKPNVDSNKPEYIGKGDGNLFMRAEVSQSDAYVNQALVYTVKLYSTYTAIKFIGATSSPKFDGFIVEESKDISNSLEYETYNGQTYATAIIARYIIFPQHDGNLSVKGNTYTVSVDQREYYRDPFYGRLSVSKPIQLNVTPNDLTVKIKPLPTPVPSDFSGGVGSFKLTSTLPAQKFASNQVGSIIYSITGTGNIKYVTLPDLQKIYPNELEVYTPSTESNVTVGSSTVSGTVKYDYSFMPLEWGNFHLPDVKLVYFNPSTGKYETSVAQGYNIVVERGEGSEKSQTKSKSSFNPDLLPVKTNLSFTHRPYVAGFLYWLFYIIPIGLIIIAYVWYKSYLAANSDIEAVRSRKANRMAMRRLKRANSFLKSGDRDGFYDEILSSIWGYLGDKLHIPVSELSRENISGKLAMKDISDEDIKQVITLIDEAEFEKYAPAAAATEMSEIYNKTISIMNMLENAFRASKN